MSPDLKILKNFQCSKMKRTRILNKALANDLKGYLCNFIKALPYSLVNDDSNDNSITKMNGTCALILDVNYSKTVDFRLYFSTGKTLFNAVKQALKKQEIMSANCISVGLDSTNLNVVEGNSIKSRALKENKSVFVARCNCYFVHLAAGQGEKAFTNISGFNMEVHLAGIYFYFKRSTQRR